MVHVLVYLLDHNASGTVWLKAPAGVEHAIYFQNGCPAKVRTGREIGLLGQILVSSGMLTPEQVQDAVADAKSSQMLFGEVLVAQGLVTHEALIGALHQQIVIKVQALTNEAPNTSYALFRDANLLEAWAGPELFPCDPLTVIHQSVRAWTDRHRIRSTLYRVRERKLVLHPQADLSTMVLNEEAKPIMRAIETGEKSFLDLYGTRVASEEEITSLVYALAITRQFAFGAAKGNPMAVREV